MIVRTLFARLRAPDQPLTVAGPAAERALRESILENVRNIVRTRRGTVPMRPDYGLPDMSEMVHSFPEASRDIERALQHTIATYEPRLRNVIVRAVRGEPGDLVLRFEVFASLVDQNNAVRFETRLSPVRPPEVR